MRRISLLSVALLAGASALPAQTFWDSSLRLAPQYQSYDLKSPLNEKISAFSFPLFVVVPISAKLSMDVGTSYAMATLKRQTFDAFGNPVTTESEMSGLTDTQLRATYAFGQDFVVATAGVNLPTGSATVDPEKVDAATRIGSDFLMFPVSGFGSGLGFTGGLAIARPMGTWNVGFGTSVRYSSEYEPYRDASGVATKFTPGPEYRARLGADIPYGTGRMSFGMTYSKFGDDKANATSFTSGDRYIAQFAMNNTMKRDVDWSFVLWNLFRTSGTLINGSDSPSGNITNGMVSFGVRAPGELRIEPSIEARLWTQENSKTSALTTLGTRLFIDRGGWAIVPGFGFSLGTMEGSTLTGFRGTLGMRFGG
jgi:hypothetical protein